LRLETVFKLQ